MNIFIANLNYKVQDVDLQDLFEEYGEVSSSKVVMDKMTGKSKGYGFVEMANDADGQKAIQELDGVEYEGRAIVVKKAKPREEGGSFGGGNRRRPRD